VILNAPAKLNLCLYVGPLREDGMHELCSLFAPISLADRLTVEAAAEDDQVVAPAALGPGPDLSARALAALREAGWSGDPVRIDVEKLIPVAAGLGGGSADAAAVLRLARGDLPEQALVAIAGRLGADVISQLDPRFCLVGGAGEEVTDLAEPTAFAAVLIPDREGLSTPRVYAEADRLGSTRGLGQLEAVRAELAAAAGSGAHPLDYRDLLVNDLAAAALSLRPALAGTLAALERAGAGKAIVTGSGPTAVGIVRSRGDAVGVADELRAAGREAIVVASGAEG
jgi:4-diphosphocytidyl-2-C-methyl-D-erythritol kinase